MADNNNDTSMMDTSMDTTGSSSILQHVPIIADRIKRKILDSVEVSPVTIVVGPTGCGKSTQVPCLLLDGMASLGNGSDSCSGGRVLCSQPRRLAAIAIATRVAKQRNTDLGGEEVGYQIGQETKRTSDTKLVFCTAGLLLEEMRAHGIQALLHYKVIVMDECHERSPESDLVLALLKHMLLEYPNKQLRIVLMSATFDHLRYQHYFATVPGCENIDTITLETAESFQRFHENVETKYMEDIGILRTHSAKHGAWWSSFRNDPDADMQGGDGSSGKSLTVGLLDFVQDLVETLDATTNTSGAYLIFAPTYNHLEQLYERLRRKEWKLGVLHSAVDMDHILRDMDSDDQPQQQQHRRRKVLLASAIADSSITIPGVCAVIDLCRSLSVEWDTGTNQYMPRTVWTSQSICDQRRGRTGRTCAGTVYRLVPKGFFVSRMPQWDTPQLTLSSCRDEVLKILCAGKAVASSPKKLLKQCLDPPDEQIVELAIVYLEKKGACERIGKKKRVVPTRAGELMAALPFRIEDSVTVLQGARLGLLHEALTLMAISTHKPPPISHHFGDNFRNEEIMRAFYPDVQMNNPVSVNLAHLSAYLCYEINWGSPRSAAALEHFAFATGASSMDESCDRYTNDYSDASTPCCGVWKWTESLEEKHMECCADREINPTSVRCVSDLVTNALNVFFRAAHEPEWLRCALPTPQWLRTEERMGGGTVLELVYGPVAEVYMTKALTSLCQGTADAASHAAMLRGYTLPQMPFTTFNNLQPLACIHFLQNNCKFGDRCRLSHAPHARLPPCRFYSMGMYCSKGNKCLYSHEAANDSMASYLGGTGLLDSIAPVDGMLDEDGLCWFMARKSSILLLGEDKNFSFTSSLRALGCSPAFSSCRDRLSANLGLTALFQVDMARAHLNADIIRLVNAGRIDCFSWAFPHTDSMDDHDSKQESLLLGTFHSLAQLFKQSQTPSKFEFALTLRRDTFARWNVLRSAARSGWRLSGWGEFRKKDFPDYVAVQAEGSARFYVFTRVRVAI